MASRWKILAISAVGAACSIAGHSLDRKCEQQPNSLHDKTRAADEELDFSKKKTVTKCANISANNKRSQTHPVHTLVQIASTYFKIWRFNSKFKLMNYVPTQKAFS